MNIYSEKWMQVCGDANDLSSMASALNGMIACGCYGNGTIADAIQDVSEQVNRLQANFRTAQKEEENDSNADNGRA